MSEVLEYAARLSQVIGARPGGTEEEQQASFFIEETLKEQSGLNTFVEEFNCNPNYELPRIICCIVTVLLGILAIPLSLMVIPAFIITLITAILFAMEVLGVSPLNNLAKRGISQNVIARYTPGAQMLQVADDVLDGGYEAAGVDGMRTSRRGQSPRKRKIVLVARYDSGKVMRELTPPIFNMLGIIHWVELAGMALVPIVLLIRMISNAEGVLLVVLNVLMAVGVIAAFIPILVYIFHQTASYSDGANNNASGVAVLLEVAQRIGSASKEVQSLHNEADAVDDMVVMHGGDAILSSGMLPVDTDLVYDESAMGAGSDGLEERTQRAQDLIDDDMVPDGDALTVPVGEAEMQAVLPKAASENPWIRDAAASAAASAGAASADPAFSPLSSSSQQGSSSDVPDWFKRGIEKANANKESRSEAESVAPVHRSRFADALDAASQASEGAIEELEARENTRLAAVSSSVAMRSAWPHAQAQPQTSNEQMADVMAPTQPQTPIKAEVVAAIEEAQAAEAAALAQAAEEVAEQAETADRTISFIPMAAEISAEISASEVVETTEVGADTGSKTPSEILADASAIAEESEGVDGDEGSKRKKRTLALPSLTGALEAVSAVQNAPLADDAEREAGEGRTLIATPVSMDAPLISGSPRKSISREASGAGTSSSAGSHSGTLKSSKGSSRNQASVVSSVRKARLIDNASEDAAQALSTLDAEPSPANAVSFTKKKGSTPSSSRASRIAKTIPTVNAAGSFVAASSTSNFEPVGDELIADMVEDDIVIEDVDDSAYEVNTTVTGAPAGPGYVNMPKSRAQRLRGLFGRKKKTEETSFSEAMGIDANFDAREVGAARGGWESFKNESADYESETSASKDSKKNRSRSHVDEYGTMSHSIKLNETSWDDGAWDDDSWNGGAFSLSRKADEDGTARSVRKGRNSKTTSGAQRRKNPGEMLAAMAQEAEAEVNASEAAYAVADGSIGAEDMIDERERIRSFRASSAPLTSFADVAAFAGSMSSGLAESVGLGFDATEGEGVGQQGSPMLQTEVWFVALGAELADNAGMKAFLAEHSQEMRGAVIIDIEAMGAGTLSLIDEEGILRKVKASSRMKRYVTKAGQSLGLHINSAKMDWCESAAYVAASQGLQTIHVAGMQDGKPAYAGEEGDRLENLSEEKLLEGAAFVLELLHNI